MRKIKIRRFLLNLYEVFEADIKKEEFGSTLKFGDTEFKIARMGQFNRRWSEYIREYGNPFESALKDSEPGKVLDQDIAINDEVIDLLAKSIVVSWSNVKDKKNNDLEFSIENCKKLLKDIPFVSVAILRFSLNIENYRKEQEAEEKKPL
jgi:hypothetical protein